MKKKTIRGILLGIVVCLFLGGTVYVNTIYHARPTALVCPYADLTVTTTNHTIVVQDEHPQAGFIFYPGAKVEPTAYLPLMYELAEQHLQCILVKMPLNLAILNPNADDSIRNQYPEISTWILGGHSLGAAMAANAVATSPDAYLALVLLAGYSTKDLSNTSLLVQSIYGSNDDVLNLNSYEKYRTNLPKTTTEIVIPGGNHAAFGDYGPQDGDGSLTIPAEQQIQITTDAILTLLNP